MAVKEVTKSHVSHQVFPGMPPCEGCELSKGCQMWSMACKDFQKYTNGHKMIGSRRPTRAIFEKMRRERD